MGDASDPSTKVYWANYYNQSIYAANLDGSDPTKVNTSGVTVGNPSGVAIDPGTGKTYWADYALDTISYANLDGSGGSGELNTSGALADPGTGPDPSRQSLLPLDERQLAFVLDVAVGVERLAIVGELVDVQTCFAARPTQS